MSEHSRFQRAEQPGAGTLTIRGSYAIVTVEAAEDVEMATVTVAQSTPAGSPDTDAFLDGVKLSTSGPNLTVELPRGSFGVRNGGGMMISNVGSGTMVIGNQIIQSSGGISMVQSGGRTYVNGQLIDGNTSALPEPIRVAVRLPIGSSLDLRLDSGDIKAVGAYDTVSSTSTSASVEVHTAKRLSVNTTSGDTRIDRAGDVNHRSVSGDLRVGYAHSLRSGTTSGDIKAKQIRARAEANSVSGDIDIHALGNTDINVGTVSGDIEITAEPGFRPNVQHSTVSGRVRVP